MNKKIIVRKNEEKRILQGHLWVFSNEIQSVEGAPENGDIAAFYSHSGSYLGSGFYNKHSLIAGRILTRGEMPEIRALLVNRMKSALDLRLKVCNGRQLYRLVHSESDLLPGLIIDKYNETYVMQCNSAGMHKLHQTIVDILVTDFGAKNVLSVNDSRLLEMEGVGELPAILYGASKTEIVHDGIASYIIDFSASQKTGMFLDQAENRKYAAGLCKDANVLDAFCNSGGFGINALVGGAARVDFIDISQVETDNVLKNLQQNALDLTGRHAIYTGDVFDFLEKKAQEGAQYDVVILDPPTFAKSRKSIPPALKAYQKMHRLALQVVKKNGFICTASCSHHIGYDDYLETAAQAAQKLGMEIQLIHSAGAGPDHPELPRMTETGYLKFLIFRKI